MLSDGDVDWDYLVSGGDWSVKFSGSDKNWFYSGSGQASISVDDKGVYTVKGGTSTITGKV